MELALSIFFGVWIAVTALVYRAVCAGGKGHKK